MDKRVFPVGKRGQERNEINHVCQQYCTQPQTLNIRTSESGISLLLRLGLLRSVWAKMRFDGHLSRSIVVKAVVNVVIVDPKLIWNAKYQVSHAGLS